jgi:hypothetical protein
MRSHDYAIRLGHLTPLVDLNGPRIYGGARANSSTPRARCVACRVRLAPRISHPLDRCSAAPMSCFAASLVRCQSSVAEHADEPTVLHQPTGRAVPEATPDDRPSRATASISSSLTGSAGDW